MADGSVGDEISRIAQWLTATLSDDTTMQAFNADGADGVHFGRVSPGGKFPATVFNFQGGSDVRGAGPLRIGVNGVWVVKAVTEGNNILDAQAGADQIDVLLQASSGSADGADIFACVRDAPFYLDEYDPATKKSYQHVGGRYRIFAQHIP